MDQTEISRRDRIIVRTSVLGIAANLLLAGAKAAVGLLSHSIAIVLDAVNNVSDVLSSVITIIGTHLAGKMPDKKHPLGHGRMEYVSAMLVAAVVLYAGIAAAWEAFGKLLHPEDPHYTAMTFGVMAGAVAVKLLLGFYVRGVGKRVNSGALTASGADALFDAAVSLSVLIAAGIFLLTGFNSEGIVGLLISAVIIRAGVGMLSDALDDLLGKRFDSEYLSEIRETICEDPLVHGAYDLILHSYGPERYIGSVHVEVDDTLTAAEIDRMQRRIAAAVLERHGVLLTGIGIYALNTENAEIAAMRREIAGIVTEHQGVLQMHGFFADLKEKTVHFDVIIDYALRDRQALYLHIKEDVQEAYPAFTFQITMDMDI